MTLRAVAIVLCAVMLIAVLSGPVLADSPPKDPITVDFVFSEVSAPAPVAPTAKGEITPLAAGEGEETTSGQGAEQDQSGLWWTQLVTVNRPAGTKGLLPRVLARRTLGAEELARWRSALASVGPEGNVSAMVQALFLEAAEGAQVDPSMTIPQKALLAALIQMADQPKMLVGFDAKNGPLVSAKLSSKSYAPGAGGELGALRAATRGVQGVVYTGKRVALPVQGAKVTFGEYSAVTDPEGYFDIDFAAPTPTPAGATATSKAAVEPRVLKVDGKAVPGVSIPTSETSPRVSLFVRYPGQNDAAGRSKSLESLTIGGALPALTGLGGIGTALGTVLGSTLYDWGAQLLPLHAGMAYTASGGLGAYAGLKLDMERRVLDRRPRAVAVPVLSIEICEYAVGDTPMGREVTLEEEEAARGVVWAEDRWQKAQADAEVAAADLATAQAEVRRLDRNVELAEESVREAEEALKAGEASEKESLRTALATANDNASTVSTTCQAARAALPAKESAQRVAEAVAKADELLLQAHRWNLKVLGLNPNVSTDVQQGAEADAEQAKKDAERALRMAETLLGQPLLRKPPPRPLAEAGDASSEPAQVTGLPLRFLRVKVGAMLSEAQLSIEGRRRPSRFGLTVGAVMGRDSESSAAVGVWGLPSDNLSAAPMVGYTLGSESQSSEVMWGLTLPLSK